MPRSPLFAAGRRLKGLGQAESAELFDQLLFFPGVGEKVLDPLEPGLGRLLEAVEEINFIEKHGEICTKLGHG
jgi:hypothetical protein